MSEGILCGVDTGGTFTDCVLLTDGRIVRAKASSTPRDFAVGFFDALAAAGEQLGLGLAELMPRLTHLVYGTTVATNIVVERDGAHTGLLTTRGFADTLLMMRAIGRVTGLSPEQLMHLSATGKPRPLVPRELTAEVPERIDCFGDIVTALDEDACRAAIATLLEQGVDAIAIAFLWSFVNPAHEHRARELAHELAPELYVSCSAELAPKWGEYERTATAAINAYVGPATRDYMRRITARARELGVASEPLILQCSGGAIPIGQAGADAVRTIGSGPAAGVIASAELGRRLGIENVICTDVGGTTFDVGLMRGGRPVTSDTSIVSQYRYYVPTVDVKSIGAGGGSIAWIDAASGTLRVGPQSAGADPGPACYSRGGTRPTVTDACLVLGYLGADALLAGRLRLDRDAARRAVGTVAAPLGLTEEEAAAGIVRIAEMHMADLIRKVTIQRGYDPSDFALFAYGGGGPVHAGVFGAELGVDRVLMPLGDSSSLWSAFGAAASDVQRVFELSHLVDAPLPSGELTEAYEGLERRAAAWLADQGFAEDATVLRRHAELRYKAQVNQVGIPVTAGRLDETAAARLLDDFERAYAGLYGEGTGYRAAGIELTALRVEAVGCIDKPHLRRDGAAPPTAAGGRSRPVWWSEHGRWVDTAVLAGESLAAGVRVAGPAIVEFVDTTLVVHPDQAARADELGNVELLLEG
ncbi:MAG: hydantoinase/oxoprolinase family protein [Solirubrobacteraceae bacterium]